LKCDKLPSGVVPLICSHVKEMAMACVAPGLRRCLHLLEALDGIQAHAAAQWGSTRTQGGSPAPAAERLVELKDELRIMPPKLVRIADALRGYPPKSLRGKYIQGLLKGYSGADLKHAMKLSNKAMRDNRVWLKSIVR
jgi:hypothetical protein